MENNKKNILVIGKGAVVSAFAKKLAKFDNVGKVLDSSADLVKSTTEGIFNLLSGKKAK